MPNNNIKNPLLIVYTGDGKGKTSSAMGLVIRGIAHDAKVAVFQFIKSDALKTGEKILCKKLGVRWENYGTGFLYSDEEFVKAKSIFIKGWQVAKEAIVSGKYHLVVLDELTYLLNNQTIALDEVIAFFESLKQNPNRPHVVITGRSAPKRLIEISNLVSEINSIKHPFDSENIQAQKIIEY